MSIVVKGDLEIKFKKGCYPTENDFKDLLDSYVHKDDMVDVSQIKQTVEGINTSLPDMLNNVKSEAIDAANDYTDTALETKVDKETGKGLSSNDYTDAEKGKLANIETGAQVNVQANWNQTDTTADDYIKNKPNISDISDKMDKSNPTGSGCLSMNRKADTTIGDYSVAEGFNCEASGNFSHAEGRGTVASEKESHAEGYFTKATGPESHAEGVVTNATGNTSHAEGYYTVASGFSSHAEGYFTEASLNNSHAEGEHTKALSLCQHVQGKYNIEDNRNIYADIVGNGTSTTRSNAYTLDWSGNGWYQGNVTAKNIPNSPTEDGSYILTCTVTNGVAEYSWELQQ